MDLDTWVSLAAILVAALTLGATVTRQTSNLDTKLDAFRAELKTDIARLDTKIDDYRAELKTDIARLDTKMDDYRAEARAENSKVEERLYELAIGLKQRSLIVPPHTA